jgi:hypothetical protein
MAKSVTPNDGILAELVDDFAGGSMQRVIRKAEEIQFSDLQHTPRKKRFLMAFVLAAGNVTRAAKAAGIARATHYAWVKDDPEYAASYRECQLNAADVLEDEARRRAVEGTLKGVYYKGVLVDMEVEYSDRLLIQLLKAHHPAHRPTLTIDGRGKNGATAVEQTAAEDLAKLPEEILLEQIKVARETIEWLNIPRAA